MSIEIKNYEPVRLYIEELSNKIIDDKVKNKIGNFLMMKIKERTLKGYDVNGEVFEDYSPKYSLLRRDKGLSTYLVDLFFTGSMFASMTYTTDNDQIRLFFSPTSDKKEVSNPSKAYWLNQKREFFSINSEEIAEVIDLYENHVKSL